MPYVGFTATSPLNFRFGPGQVVINYGVANTLQLGATRGGATFRVEREIVDPQIDGVPGPVKGARYRASENGTLEITSLEHGENALKVMLSGLTKTSDSPTGFDTFAPPALGVIPDSEYFANVALLIDVPTKGNPAILLLENVLNTNPFEIVTADKELSTGALSFTGSFDPATLTSPYRIRLPRV